MLALAAWVIVAVLAVAFGLLFIQNVGGIIFSVAAVIAIVIMFLRSR